MLRFERYEALSSRSGWERTLPNTEEPLSVAVGATFVAVATDAACLHIFSLGGVHVMTLAVAGPPVAVAAHGGVLTVAWHRSSPTAAGNQCLDFLVRTHSALRFAH